MTHLLTHYDHDVLPNPHRGREPRACRVCGKPFTPPGTADWKTCSYACSRVWPEYADEKPDPSRRVMDDTIPLPEGFYGGQVQPSGYAMRIIRRPTETRPIEVPRPRPQADHVLGHPSRCGRSCLASEADHPQS